MDMHLFNDRGLPLLFDADHLRQICEDYHKMIVVIEEAKYDIEKEVEFKDYRVTTQDWTAEIEAFFLLQGCGRDTFVKILY